MVMDEIKRYLKECKTLALPERVAIYNEMVELLKDMLAIDHPVLAVKLIEGEKIQSNDYNPNKVAPPEMTLLELSIARDGVTIPVVAARNDKGRYIIVDGFHRTQVLKYFPPIRAAMHGYIPVVELNKSVPERIAATVRHNMARGSHQTDLVARLVGLLKKHDWTDERSAKSLAWTPMKCSG